MPCRLAAATARAPPWPSSVVPPTVHLPRPAPPSPPLDSTGRRLGAASLAHDVDLPGVGLGAARGGADHGGAGGARPGGAGAARVPGAGPRAAGPARRPAGAAGAGSRLAGADRRQRAAGPRPPRPRPLLPRRAARPACPDRPPARRGAAAADRGRGDAGAGVVRRRRRGRGAVRGRDQRGRWRRARRRRGVRGRGVAGPGGARRGRRGRPGQPRRPGPGRHHRTGPGGRPQGPRPHPAVLPAVVRALHGRRLAGHARRRALLDPGDPRRRPGGVDPDGHAGGAALTGTLATGEAPLVLGFESARLPVDAELAAALEVCADAGGRALDADAGGDAGATWRASFVRAPYLRERLVLLGVLAETFETAVTWERLDGLVAGVRAATAAALAATCGAGTVTCRLTHAYPDGAAPYFTVLAPARRGAELG